MPEALETWPIALFEIGLPRHLEIIYEVNRRFLDDVRARYPGDEDRVRRISLIQESPEKRVRMAHLAVVGSHSTNGVAAIHSDLLRTTVLKDLAEHFPDRFNNKTNGVTPRRWLLLANPDLSGLITEAIGEGWVTKLAQLGKLVPLANDAAFRDGFRAAKRAAKARFADWLQAATGHVVDPDSIFDSQIKRIHEYKRQLLNVLHVLVLYNRLRENPSLDVPPRTFFFAGKAAPAYTLAKLIIHLINNVAAVIDADPAVRGRLKVLFLPEYNVTPGPAADPGQRRLGADFHRRLRGQRHKQHEVHDERGADRRHTRRRDDRDGQGGRRGELFPVRPDRRAGPGQPWLVRSPLARRERAGDASRPGPDPLRCVSTETSRASSGRSADTLLTHGDHYMHLADLTSYVRVQEQVVHSISSPTPGPARRSSTSATPASSPATARSPNTPEPSGGRNRAPSIKPDPPAASCLRRLPKKVPHQEADCDLQTPATLMSARI